MIWSERFDGWLVGFECRPVDWDALRDGPAVVFDGRRDSEGRLVPVPAAEHGGEIDRRLADMADVLADPTLSDTRRREARLWVDRLLDARLRLVGER